MGSICYSKAAKRQRLLILSRKQRVTLPQQQKTFITLSIERKVCIIGVEIRQPVVKI